MCHQSCLLYHQFWQVAEWKEVLASLSLAQSASISDININDQKNDWKKYQNNRELVVVIRAGENAESARSAIYAILLAHICKLRDKKYRILATKQSCI